MLRALMDKGDSMQEKMDNISRAGNPTQEPKQNATDQKH